MKRFLLLITLAFCILFISIINYLYKNEKELFYPYLQSNLNNDVITYISSYYPCFIKLYSANDSGLEKYTNKKIVAFDLNSDGIHFENEKKRSLILIMTIWQKRQAG